MDAELHLAVRYQHPNTRKTALIEIFKRDASTHDWQKFTTLGDYALFLGTGTSISVKASDYSATKCKPNVFARFMQSTVVKLIIMKKTIS
ncbi:hypothetical protein FRX31_004576 [Thalictrum thalictroides]|uniref:KIB1-4 beta-propeller domain-containing protein n=1 Tax=Thalictrum thalictroides TaxID=46969 RepID=A0A7J6X7R5_THATH|nr:hypothetical protein FRX31_004576 [Thalictrum thalictroides]